MRPNTFSNQELDLSQQVCLAQDCNTLTNTVVSNTTAATIAYSANVDPLPATVTSTGSTRTPWLPVNYSELDFTSCCQFCTLPTPGKICSLCELDSDFILDDRKTLVRFGNTVEHRYDPDSIIDEPLFVEEPDYPTHIELGNSLSLLDLADPLRRGIDDEDRRLSEIMNAYVFQDAKPPKRTLLDSVKDKVTRLRLKFANVKNPFIGSTNDDLYFALQAIYYGTHFDDLSCVTDPFERELAILRDANEFYVLEDVRRFNRVTQALRLRCLNKTEYTTIMLISDVYMKNRENAKKNRQREQFEPQADLYTPLYLRDDPLLAFMQLLFFVLWIFILTFVIGFLIRAFFVIKDFYDIYKMAKQLDLQDKLKINEDDIFEPQGWGDWKIHHDLPSEVVEKLDGVSDNVTEALKQMEETMKSVSTTADTANDLMKMLPVLLTVLSLAIMCTSKNKGVWAPLFVAAVAGLAAMYSDEIRLKINKFVDLITAPESETLFESQANNENPIIGLALMLTTLATIGEAPKGRRSTSFLKGIGEIPKLTDGLTSVTAFVIDLVVRCTNEVKTMIYGCDFETWTVKTVSEVDTWCDKVRQVAVEYHNGSLELNLANRDRVFTLETESAALSAKLFTGVEGIRVKNALSSYGRMLKKVVDAFMCFSPNKKSVRQEPYVICFAGPPGAGKSWVVNMFNAAILPRILPKELLDEYKRNDPEFTYQRFFEEEYFTDYKNQFVTVLDDFMQSRDVLGQPGELLEFIRMVNSAPYTLHMADLQSKGKYQFNSKLIIVNTNQKDFEVCSIQSKEAFLRRVDCMIHTSTKPKYCTPETAYNTDPWERKLNKDHPELKDSNGIQVFNKDIYQLYRAKYRDPRNHPDQYYYEPGTLDFDSLLDVVEREYKKKEYVADAYYNTFRETISRGVDLRMEPQALTDYELPKFITRLPKVDIATSDLTLDDLEEDQEQTEKDLAMLLPSFQELHVLGSTEDLIDFLIVKYPAIWKSFSGMTARQYAHCSAYAESDYIDLVNLIWKIRSKPERASEMDKHVRQYLTNDFLINEKMYRDDLMSFFDDVKTKANQLLVKYPSLVKMLKIAGILGTVGLMIFGLWKAFAASQSSDEFLDESHPKKGKTPVRNANRGQARHGPAEFVSEAGGDTNNFELTKKLVVKSLYSVKLGDRKLGNAFVYRGHRCLIPYHYVTMVKDCIAEGDFEEDGIVHLRAYHTEVEMPVPVSLLLAAKRTTALAERDLCVFNLPTHFHAHPDMLPHFAPAATHAKKLDFDCTLIMPDDFFVSRDRMRVIPIDEKRIKNDICDYIVRGAYMYPCSTKKGDCGSILTIDDISIKEKIVGLHVAGTKLTGKGLSVALVREEFDEVELCFEKAGQRAFPAPIEVTMESQADRPPAPGFHPYLTLPKKVYGPVESKIRKSMLYGTVATVLTQPAPLRKFKADGKIIDPRFNAISRYAAPCISQVTPHTVSICARSLLARMMRVSSPYNKESLISFEDSVLGRPGVKFFDSIPRNTSAGYPYVLDPVAGYHHKQWFFGKGDDYDLTRPACVKLREECLEILEKAKRGERSYLPFIDVLKDETVSHAKAAIGKTRLVSAAPLHLTIVTRMLFMPFSKWMMDNRGLNCSAIGANPYEEWDFFARNLKSKGPAVIAGDFSGYDSRQLSVVLLAICDMINDWFDDGPELRLARLTIFQEVINSIHISGDTVYQWASKLPSGHPLTGILNTLQTNILLMLCWVDLNPQGEKGLENYWNEVYPLGFGDDHILNVSQEALAYYNFPAIQASMSKWNQIYTDETKGVANYLSKSLEESGFLKRGFRYEERIRRYVAPLALESILDMLNWYTEGPERTFVQQTNVETALRELALHDRETFDIWSKKILSAARNYLQFVPPVVNYRLLQDACLAKELAW